MPPPPRLPTRVSPTTVVVARDVPLVTTAGDPKSRALALVAEVHAIKHQMSASAYRLGVVLRALSAPAMVAALECTSFEEVLAAHDLPSRMTALKYVALAEHFDEPVATELGAEKGYALVRYGRALARPEEPTALLARNAKLAGVPLRDASAAEILRAARDLLDKQRESAAAEDDSATAADKAVRRLGAKLRKAGARGAKLRRMRRGGTWRVVVELDADEAAALAAAL